MKKEKRKPTIAELEHVLEEPGKLIVINPDGSITTGNKKYKKKPKILTIDQAIANSY